MFFITKFTYNTLHLNAKYSLPNIHVYRGQKDKREPISYQPISLISNPCKIYSGVMNDRLIHYLEKEMHFSGRAKWFP